MPDALRAIQADAKADPEGVVVPLVTDDGTQDCLIPPASMWFEGAVEAPIKQLLQARRGKKGCS